MSAVRFQRSPVVWDPEQTLLTPSPALLPVNGELPSLLNLRIVSRSLHGRAEVIAAAGNNLFRLRQRIEECRPRTVAVELVPDHIDTLLGLDVWLSEHRPSCRILVVGAALRFWSEYLLDRGRTLTLGAPGNPIQTLAALTTEQAQTYTRAPDSELKSQPIWEKRRLTVGLGCPADCFRCPRKADEGVVARLRTVRDAMAEITDKLRGFGIRNVDVVGPAWASDAAWAQAFLEERIRLGLEVNLHLVLTESQLTKSLATLLVPGGCTRLLIRTGLEVPNFEPGLTRALKDLAERGRIVLVCPVQPLEESARQAARRVSAFKRAVQAHSAHVLLHTEADVPPACSELGRLVEQGQMNLHFGITDRRNDQVRAWAREFGGLLCRS